MNVNRVTEQVNYRKTANVTNANGKQKTKQAQGVISSIKVQQNGVVNACAVVECGARNISYAESDYVKTYVEEALAEFYDFIQDRIKNGPPKYLIGSSEFSVEEWDKLLESIDEQLDDMREETEPTEAQIRSLLEERTIANNGAPYNHLAKNGIIEYNGVVFVCDDEYRALCLGDTTDMANCIRIPLSEGGCLIVNRENLGDLANAISMFSPEDVNLIMRAIAQDAKIQQLKKEIEDESSAIELDSNSDSVK